MAVETARQADADATPVRGGGGLQLHVREWGPPDGPAVLFVHGWSQNHLCWAKQYDSDLADELRLVAFDLRGHGMSETPLAAEHYTDDARWADDLAAIIDALDLDRTVLVGWSYGAFVICDYLRAHGPAGVAAINMVEGVTRLGEAAFGTLIGPGFLDHFVGATTDDLPTNIATMRSFVRTCLASPWPTPTSRPPCAGTSSCRRAVRANLAARQLDYDDVLRTMTVPAARHPRPCRHRRAAGDGRAHHRHLPDRRSLLVRQRRPRPPPRSARALQPRACHAQPRAMSPPRTRGLIAPGTATGSWSTA